jgi:MGT family glycosyltransferase
MARVLIMPHSPPHALAHVGACHTAAVELGKRGHEVILGYGGALSELIAPGGHRLVHLAEIAPEEDRVLSWFSSPLALEQLVESDRRVISDESPDVVVSDSRPSAPIAANDLGLPDIGLFHFLGLTPWSKTMQLDGRRLFRRVRHPVRSFGRWWEDRRRQSGAAELGEIVHAVRSRHGLPPIVNALAGGSEVACTSTPIADPVDSLPPNWHYVGHPFWSARGVNAESEVDETPMIYVTQGTSGDAATLTKAVRETASLPVQVVASSAHLCDPAELEALGANVRASRYVASRSCLERATVAVIHGGHLTASEAHLTGTPVVVVPTGSDHFVWATRVQRLGTGIPVQPPLIRGRIRRAVRRLLSDESYRRNAASVRDELLKWDLGANLDAIVRRLAVR